MELQRRRRRKPSMSRRKKVFIGFISFVTLAFLSIIVYLTSAYFFSTNELAKTFKDFNTSDQASTAIEDTEPFSILLMGVDTGSKERTSTWEGNSDSMILVTVNPKTKKTTMTSLERDILVNLTGTEGNSMDGVEAKLNAAYASGGAEMAILTVQDLLGISIDNYVQINMQGLVDLVDAVGGITVTNNFDFPISIEANEPEYTATVEPGTHHINGEQALVYSRLRYDDPEGDYGRQKRQREVIQKVMKKILSLNSVTSYRKILKAISGNMQTNIAINTSTIPKLLAYQDALKNISSYQLRGEDAEINGGSYQIVTTDHLLTVQNRIRKQLGLETLTELTSNAVLYESLYGYSPDGTPYSTEATDGAYGQETTYGYAPSYETSQAYPYEAPTTAATDPYYTGETSVATDAYSY